MNQPQQDFHGLHHSHLDGFRHSRFFAIEDQHYTRKTRPQHRKSRRPSRKSSGSSSKVERAQTRHPDVHSSARLAVGDSAEAIIQGQALQGDN